MTKLSYAIDNTSGPGILRDELIDILPRYGRVDVNTSRYSYTVTPIMCNVQPITFRLAPVPDKNCDMLVLIECSECGSDLVKNLQAIGNFTAIHHSHPDYFEHLVPFPDAIS